MSVRRRAAAREVGVGIVGLGFMGRTHLAAYRAAAAAGFPNRVLAVCCRTPPRLGRGTRGNLELDAPEPLELDGIEWHASPRALFADERIELVSVCTPTPTHVPLAKAALAAGKHVLVEKPVALRARDVEALAAAARAARRVCMPALCLRFWPGWSWLAGAIAKRSYGRVESAVFRRLSSRPDWSPGFYDDEAQSGGALFDLHVHDADFVRFALGPPTSVACAGTVDHLTAVYRYERGPAHVVAEGAWDLARGFPFFMGFTVVFERATADYASGRTPVLTLAHGGVNEPVALPSESGFDLEIRHLLAVLAGRAELQVTLDEAVGLTRMLAAERRSLSSGRAVRL